MSLNIQKNCLLKLSSKYQFSFSKYQTVLKKYKTLADGLVDKFRLVKSAWVKQINWEKITDARLQEFLRLNQKLGVKIVTIFDTDYPKVFSNLRDKPTVIYYLGNIDLLKRHPILTVVGSRNSNNYGKEIVQKILIPSLDSQLIVASGLAKGIDTLAHKACLQSKSSTIGVVGSGLDKNSFYPQSNYPLVKEIVQKQGLVLSEYPLGFLPTRFSFPQRNRLLAIMAQATWVVQANYKSGSLITAKIANDYGKLVLSTPGSIFDPNFAGNNQLIKDGAGIITEASDLQQSLDLVSASFKNLNPLELFEEKKKTPYESQIEKQIHQNLSLQKPFTLDYLASKTSLQIGQLSANLTMLELKGLAKSAGENLWLAI